jgi:hypothetical protein
LADRLHVFQPSMQGFKSHRDLLADGIIAIMPG